MRIASVLAFVLVTLASIVGLKPTMAQQTLTVEASAVSIKFESGPVAAGLRAWEPRKDNLNEFYRVDCPSSLPPEVLEAWKNSRSGSEKNNLWQAPASPGLVPCQGRVPGTNTPMVVRNYVQVLDDCQYWGWQHYQGAEGSFWVRYRTWHCGKPPAS